MLGVHGPGGHRGGEEEVRREEGEEGGGWGMGRRGRAVGRKKRGGGREIGRKEQGSEHTPNFLADQLRKEGP